MATVANVLHILLQFPFSSLGNLGKTKFVLLMKRMMHTAGKPECLIAKCKKGKPTYEIGIVHCNLKLQQGAENVPEAGALDWTGHGENLTERY
jgi:hypothetical protein